MRASPIPFAAHCHMRNGVNYTNVLVYHSFARQEGPTLSMKGTVHGYKKLFGTKIKANSCTDFVLGCLKNLEAAAIHMQCISPTLSV